jgi:hypothetical protein
MGLALIVSRMGSVDTRLLADSAPPDPPVEQRPPMKLIDRIDAIAIK